jgi:hypothetical protein
MASFSPLEVRASADIAFLEDKRPNQKSPTRSQNYLITLQTGITKHLIKVIHSCSTKYLL